MTRDEALRRVRAAIHQASWKTRGDPTDQTTIFDHTVLDGLVTLETLGLIKFDAPTKTEVELQLEALEAAWWACGQTNFTTGPVAILETLTKHGFTIARKP